MLYWSMILHFQLYRLTFILLYTYRQVFHNLLKHSEAEICHQSVKDKLTVDL